MYDNQSAPQQSQVVRNVARHDEGAAGAVAAQLPHPLQVLCMVRVQVTDCVDSQAAADG